MVVSNRLLQIRTAKGIVQQELSVQAGCSPTKLVAIERYNFLPSEALRKRIADALGVSEGDIWPEMSQAASK